MKQIIMERKIGEIFEYNGEWYQCMESPDGNCTHCDMNFGRKCPIPTKECTGTYRIDKKNVIFKKLEKVGEPFSCDYYGDNPIMMQEYNLYNLDDVTNENNIPMYITDYRHKRIAIEIKQTKEDMEDLDKIKVRDYTKVEELNVMEEKKLNLKPFDIQKAREGKPVCTRDGRKARIICFDSKVIEDRPLLVLINNGKGKEFCHYYTNNGIEPCNSSFYDLMMLPEKKEGWILLRKDGCVFDNEEVAKKNCTNNYFVAKVEWEE